MSRSAKVCGLKMIRTSAQRRSSGYSVNSVDTSATGGILASMSMNGDGCKAFGNDIANLMLSVEYETEQRKKALLASLAMTHAL